MTEDPAFVWRAGNSNARPVVRRSRAATPRQESPAASPPPTGAEETVPADAVLVPIDEWSRILHQLGNLHEAGQQLAEARERAAKAETESTFLKERLKETRERVEALATELEERPEPEPEPLPAFSEWFVRRWLEKRRRSDG